MKSINKDYNETLAQLRNIPLFKSLLIDDFRDLAKIVDSDYGLSYESAVMVENKILSESNFSPGIFSKETLQPI